MELLYFVQFPKNCFCIIAGRLIKLTKSGFRVRRRMYLAGLIVLLASASVNGNQDGAPTAACADMTPTTGGHQGATPLTSTFPYEVTFTKDCFKAADTVDGNYHPVGKALNSDCYRSTNSFILVIYSISFRKFNQNFLSKHD